MARTIRLWNCPMKRKLVIRPVTSLGHQVGEEFCERCPNFLNYVQNIFPGVAKIF